MTRNEENARLCEHVASTLESYALGSMYRCPECGEVIDENDYETFEYEWEKCPCCGEDADMEQLSIYDWLEDALDIEYTANANFEYKGARILVAFGGPNIYVDTRCGEVQLFWWDERAVCEIKSNRACEELDACMDEMFSMAKAS